MDTNDEYQYLIAAASEYASKLDRPWMLYEGGSIILLPEAEEAADPRQLGEEQLKLYGQHLQAQEDLGNWRVETYGDTGYVVHTAAADWKVFLHRDDLQENTDNDEVKLFAQSMVSLDWGAREIIAASDANSE